MPGTGKTTTIAHIIQILVKQGKSILLTSYTHTAVDNVLSKVRDSGIDVLRIGNVEKVRGNGSMIIINGPPEADTCYPKRSRQRYMTVCLMLMAHPTRCSSWSISMKKVRWLARLAWASDSKLNFISCIGRRCLQSNC